MKSKEEIKKWLLENCVDSAGDLNLNGLDFSDFQKNIFISCWKVKHNLYQAQQEVEGYLYQDDQSVKLSLFQDRQKVGSNLHQDNQKVGSNLHQGNQEVRGTLFQDEIKRPTEDEQKCPSTTIDYEAETDRLTKENYELKEKLEGYETLLLHIAKELKGDKK